MSFGSLDRKTAILWASAVAVILILRFFVLADRSPAVVAASVSVPAAESRLEKLRQKAATVPGKEALMKQASAELDSRELEQITRQLAGIDARPPAEPESGTASQEGGRL